MGTRNLTCVVKDNKYQIAQYGQWDGYPEGQGLTALRFLRVKENIQNLRKRLKNVRFWDRVGRDKKFLDSYYKNCAEWSSEPDNRTAEQKRWFNLFVSRDIGAEILSNICSSDDKDIILRNEIDFAKDSLMCEFCYVIDLDKNTFEIFQGFNTSPMNKRERFYTQLKNEGGYFPVRLLKKYSLNKLPTEKRFLKEMTKLLGDEDSESN